MTCYSITSSDNPNDVLWYEPAEHKKFIHDTIARAGFTRRLMKYASTNELTYNSSIGLVSAKVLKDYLSIPQEIIGIEHLLDGQCTARSSLRRHHKNALMEEQRRQKRDGHTDPDYIARMLRNNSNISAHMARERAEYSFLLD